MTIELETPRLLLRQFTVEDAPALFELNSDIEVVQYTGDVAYNNIDEVINFINNYTQYTEYKTGRLSMFLKKTGEHLGWCGLKYLPEIDEVDLGYRLYKRYWGNGYATEASIACLDYGFNTLHLNKIIARAMKANPASEKVMQKLGMKYSHNTPCAEQPGVVYAITKQEWK